MSASLRARMTARGDAYRAQIEDSPVPRAVTTVTVVLALIATAMTGAAPVLEVVVSILLVVGGNVLSHQRRHADNRLIKLLITIAVGFVMVRFFSQLGTSQTVDDARLPLTSLFLGVQSLHAFDLPRTRDLSFTVSASLALIALSAAASRSVTFLAVATVWLLLAGVSLWVLRLAADHRRSGRVLAKAAFLPDTTATIGSVSGARRPRDLVLPSLGMVALIAVVFLALPRPEVGATLTLPFQELRAGLPSPGGITNPGLPVSGDGTGDFDPVAYFGLADTVDIRTAGELSDQLILRVRSSRPRLLRGLVFDTYEDNRWTRTSEQPDAVTGLPIRLNPGQGLRENLTQTIEVVTPTPNLIFSAADPLDIYHASQSARQWSDGTVTVESTQDNGTVYSVISAVPTSAESDLRLAVGRTPDSIAETWLQVPDELTARTRALSAELVNPNRSNYVNAEAVMAWIGDNIEYSLDLEDHAPDEDAVDTILFERNLGWCEPISASMVMLLRAGGVPARWVTGFQPGDYNVLSGYWEVRAKHAHAWVEVWIPGNGWISFDPTGAVPLADGPADTSVTIPLLVLLRQARTWLAGLSPLAWLALLTFAIAVTALTREVLQRRRESAPLAVLPGVDWQPWETPTEFAARLARDQHVARAPLDVLVAVHHARLLERPGPGYAATRRAHRDVRRQLRSRQRRV